jgi:hypothetical protein
MESIIGNVYDMSLLAEVEVKPWKFIVSPTYKGGI